MNLDDVKVGDLIVYKTPVSFKKLGIYLGITQTQLSTSDITLHVVYSTLSGDNIDYISFDTGAETKVEVLSSFKNAKG